MIFSNSITVLWKQLGNGSCRETTNAAFPFPHQQAASQNIGNIIQHMVSQTEASERNGAWVALEAVTDRRVGQKQTARGGRCWNTNTFCQKYTHFPAVSVMTSNRSPIPAKFKWKRVDWQAVFSFWAMKSQLSFPAPLFLPILHDVPEWMRCEQGTTASSFPAWGRDLQCLAIVTSVGNNGVGLRAQNWPPAIIHCPRTLYQYYLTERHTG